MSSVGDSILFCLFTDAFLSVLFFSVESSQLLSAVGASFFIFPSVTVVVFIFCMWSVHSLCSFLEFLLSFVFFRWFPVSSLGGWVVKLA